MTRSMTLRPNSFPEACLRGRDREANGIIGHGRRGCKIAGPSPSSSRVLSDNRPGGSDKWDVCARVPAASLRYERTGTTTVREPDRVESREENGDMKTQKDAHVGVVGQVDELIELLERYVRRHRELRAIVRQRKDLGTDEDRHALEEIGDVEREVLADIGLLERDRITRMARLAQVLGSPSPDSMRLAELIGYVDTDQRDALLELREEIRGLADELDRFRASNRGGVAVQTLEHRKLYLAVVSGGDPRAAFQDLDEVDEHPPLFPPEGARRGL